MQNKSGASNKVATEPSSTSIKNVAKNSSTNSGVGKAKQERGQSPTPQPIDIMEEVPASRARCGLFCWRPNFLQAVYNWKLGMVLICWFTFLRGMLGLGFGAVSTSSFERQFNVESQQIGWFTSANKIAVSLSALVVSYYGDRTSNKPRMIALSAFLWTIGAFLLTLPHFIMEPYKSQSSQNLPLTCRLNNKNSITSSNMTSFLLRNSSTSNYYGVNCKTSTSTYFNVMIAGNVLIGVGGGVVSTVGIAFIDDFSSTTQSGLNVGLSYVAQALGSATGFGLGSFFLSVDVNFDKKGVAPQNQSDPSFLGAWWLGYAICIGLFATVGIGFVFFDNELPESAKLRAEKLAKAQTHVSSIRVDLESGTLAGRHKIIRALGAIVDHTVRMITNPVIIWTAIASIFQTLAMGGLTPFLVKLLQTQFQISEMVAGMTMGILVVVGIGSACLLSGLMSKRLDMSVRSLLMVTIVAGVITMFVSVGEIIVCSQEKLVGVTYDYAKSMYYPPSQPFNRSNLVSTCNADCQCDPRLYTPVCNSEKNLEFYSACYAGCKNYGIIGGKNQTDYYTYKDCSCLMRENLTSPSTKYGLCATSSCGLMYVAMIGFFIILFCAFFILVPVTEVIMRTVPLEERSFSLAFHDVTQCFLGSFPGPLLFGLIIDQSCILRQPSLCSSEDGACVVYNPITLSRSIAGIMCGLALLAILSYVVAFLLYKPPSGETLAEYFQNLVKWWRSRFSRRGKVDAIERTGEKKDERQQSTGSVEDIGYDGPYVIASL